MTEVSSRIGEVVSTSITEFEAQSVRLHENPPLGALLRVRVDGDVTIYGIAAGACTDGIDAGVRPVPRARDGSEDADVYRDHPDLVHVLKTCFQCVVAGFRERGQIYYQLPPSPAPVHYSVAMCPPSEVQAFTETLRYFETILAARDVPVEEVLAAHIRFAADARRPHPAAGETPYDFSVRAGREVAALLRNEHQRLVTILHRIRPVHGP